MPALQLNRFKKTPFLFIIPIAIAAFFPFTFLGLNIGIKLGMLAVSAGLYWLMRKAAVNEFAGSFSAIDKVLFILIVLYAGFAILGHSLFFSEYPVTQAFSRTLFFLLFCSWMSFPAFAFLYFTQAGKTWLAAKNNEVADAAPRSTRKLYVLFLSIMIGWWLLYLIGFFPATMSTDSFDEWRQAVGAKPLNDLHPILYTLIIKALISIWYSPAIIVVLQILFMAAVCSSFLVFLYKAGIPYKWVLILAILTAIIPANGIMVIVLWKDILFSCCLVWLTLLIAEIVTNTYIFNQKTTLAFLVVALLGVALLRHNGVLPAFISGAALVIWSLKNKRTGILLSLSMFLLVFFVYKKVLMPYWFKVPPVATAFQKIPFMHGMASVMHANGNLSPEASQEMEKLLPIDVWKSQYNPFSADEYLYMTNTPFIDNLSAVPTSRVLSLYTKTFIDNPFLIARDRLNGCELLWNVNQAEGSSNYSYEPNLEENEFGFKQQENGLHKVLMGMVKFFGRALDPISRRVGVFNILLLLVFLYVFKQRKMYWLIFLPLIGANLSLLLSMTFQSFRYVYYIPLLMGVLWLLAITKKTTSDNFIS
jgi:hypothetical protein